jgi:mannose-6-phosphate isomerase-like protein (cupin superfamily)
MSTTKMNVTVIRQGEAPRFGHDGTEVVGYVSPSRGEAGVSLWQLSLAAGAQSPPHQLTRGEAFLALSGEVQVVLSEHEVLLRAGDALWVPAAVPFRLRNPGSQPFVAVACMVAGGKAQIGDQPPFVPPWAV